MCDDVLNTIPSQTDSLGDNLLNPKDWLGTLPLSSCRICKIDEPWTIVPPESIDLFDFVKGGKKYTWYQSTSIIRFDPVLYPVAATDTDDAFLKDSSGHQLITDLLSVCHREGKSSYCSNGCSGSVKNTRRITCHRLLCYRGSTLHKQEHTECALRTKNSNSMITKSKRPVIRRAYSPEIRCNSFFVIHVDRQSYYMKIGTGNAWHCHHAPHDTSCAVIPARLRPPGDQRRQIVSERPSAPTGPPLPLPPPLPQELFGPLFQEITMLSQGDTMDDLNHTKGMLERILHQAKRRRAGKSYRTNKNNRSLTAK